MEILQHYNQSRLLAYMPKMKESLGDWQLVEVSLAQDSGTNVAYLSKLLKDHFAKHDGVLFVANTNEIVAIVKAHAAHGDFAAKIPEGCCTVRAEALSQDSLLKAQVQLSETESGGGALLQARRARAEKVVVVADDDMFMRSLIVKAFKDKARVIEIDDTSKVLDTYLRELPDVLFLDIHMPGGSGIDMLAQLQAFDDSAYVVIVSSDSVLDNVVDAKTMGAKGFIAKPFTTEKLHATFAKSPSVT